MSALSSPLGLAAVAASAAYLNGRWKFSNDLWLGSSIFTSLFHVLRSERAGRQNFFYVIEGWATNPKTANNLCLWFEGNTWTYAQAYSQILRYACWLKDDLRVAPGEIVALDAGNSDTFLWVWYGLWCIGAVPAFINTNLTGQALVHCVKIAGPTLLLVDDSLAHLVRGDAEREMTSDSFYAKGKGPVKVVYMDDALHRAVSARAPIRPDDSVRKCERTDPSQIVYTSGTTGLPKAGIVPSGRVSRAASLFAGVSSIKSSDRFYTSMPLYHSAASNLACGTAFFAGAALVLDRKFSASRYWQTVRESEATMIHYVGEACRWLLNAPASPLDKKHKVHTALGNGMRPDVWNRFTARFGIDTIVEFYAATEGVGTLINVSRHPDTAGPVGRTGSAVGWLRNRNSVIIAIDPATEEPVRDSNGLCIELPRGQIGELCNRLNEANIGETYQGYYGNEKASNKKVLRDVRKKGDAYFRTGDLLRLEPGSDDAFFIDRIGDTFRWKSENVATSEVSEAMGTHPAVAEANVYGVELPRHDGRAGCAAVVLSSAGGGAGAAPSEKLLSELAAHATAKLASYARPLFLRFTPAFETTGTNKTLKHVMRNQGVEPAKVKPAAPHDRVYWLRGGTYAPFGEEEWRSVVEGRVSL